MQCGLSPAGTKESLSQEGLGPHQLSLSVHQFLPDLGKGHRALQWHPRTEPMSVFVYLPGYL